MANAKEARKTAEAVSAAEREKQGLIYAMRLLSIAKRSERDLKLRLNAKGYPPDSIIQIIERLKSQKLVNDLELAKNVIQWSQFGNPIGKHRIRLELRKKGLADSVIGEALEPYDERSEHEAAERLAYERFERLKNLDGMKRRKRVYDFLIRRGFAYDVCRDIISNLGRE